MCASWESWRAALLFEVIGAFGHLLPRGLPLSLEGASAPAPVPSPAAQGYSPEPLSCCEACACTADSRFSCGFTPRQLLSAVLLLFVQTILLEELCSRTCSQDGEEQCWLYEDAGVGGMSSVYVLFCTGLLWGTAFSVTVQAVFKSKVLGLAQGYVTPVSA